MSRLVPHPKPERYIVIHTHFAGGIREEAWASYNVKLDNLNNMPTAYSQAVHTAARFNGEIFAGYSNGELLPVKTYRK